MDVILIFERNLLWSVRLDRALQALGYATFVAESVPDPLPEGGVQLAIVNLTEGDRIGSIVADLKASGIPILAHAGHGDKELMKLGKRLGVDRLATNGQMANDLDTVVKLALGTPE